MLDTVTFNELVKLSQHFLKIKNQSYKRYFIQNISLNQQLSMLVGQRGVGKTTLLIQYLLDFAKQDRFDPEILYIQTDHFLMGQTTLYDIAHQFHAKGGKYIAFDEIHQYSNWSQELKSIYDTFPDLKIIASGSSALKIYKGSHDLSRRAILYKLHGLSFREYLELYYGLVMSAYSLEDILKYHQKITSNILKIILKTKMKILPHFSNYLRYGYYPYFREINDIDIYALQVEKNLHIAIESDLMAIYPYLTGASVKKIKQLVSFISQAVPFIPQWKKIKDLINIGDERTLKNYFKYLEDAQIIQCLNKSTKKLRKIESAEKIYLNNSNQMFALSFEQQNIGTVRETFFLNMLSTQHQMSLPGQGDFLIDGKYCFEIGGSKKTFKQLKNAEEENSYLACDNIEQGIGNKIPLWLFGFLY